MGWVSSVVRPAVVLSGERTVSKEGLVESPSTPPVSADVDTDASCDNRKEAPSLLARNDDP